MGRTDRRPGTLSGDTYHNRRAGRINRGFTNYSMSLDGVDQMGDTGNGTDVAIDNTDAYSIVFWFKTGSAGVEMLCTKMLTTGTLRGYQMFLNAGSLQMYLANTTGTNAIYTGTITSTFDDNAWHCAAWTSDGGQDATSGWDLYVDDVLLSDTIFDNNLAATTVDTGCEFAIGARNGASITNYSDTQWAQCGHFPRKLSAADVTTIYNSSKLYDLNSLATGRPVHYFEPRSTSLTLPDLGTGGAASLVFNNVDPADFSSTDIP